MKERYWWVFKRRGIVMAPLVVFLALCTFWECENHWIVYLGGGLVFLSGFLLRVWAQVHLHYRLHCHKVLTLTGPYQYVRNPIYIANTLILLSLCIASELMWFLPIMLLWCMGVYHFVVRYEEAHLAGKYGEPYLDFLRRVPRWMPRFRKAVRIPASGMRAYLRPSIWAELHCFLLFVPFVFKEMLF